MSDQEKPVQSPLEKLRVFAKQVLSAPKKDVERALANEKQMREAKRKSR